MTNLGFGTADVGGAFVKDLALELGKAPATLVAYLKKHLPDTLTKRKNDNNRLANFVTEDGVQGLRAHYKPAIPLAVTQALVKEYERLLEENARLRLENERLRSMLPQGETVEEIEQKVGGYTRKLEGMLTKVKSHGEVVEEAVEVADGMLDIVKTNVKNTWRQTNDERKQQTAALKQQAAKLRKLLDEQDEQYARETRVIRFPTEKVRDTKE